MAQVNISRDSQMKKNLIFLIFVLNYNFALASTSAPQCPRTPLKASIGDQLPNGWLIWKRKEIYSWWKGFKYRHFKETYKIDKWDDTLEGYYSINSKQTRYYIACCKHKSKNDYFLCAMKEMDMVQYCKAPLLPYDPPIFNTCTPWGKDKREIS
jgi:hypothetical protein